MTISREHSVLLICLAMACGGALDAPRKAFGERDAAVVAATTDSPSQAEVVYKNKVVFFGRSGAAVGASITAVSSGLSSDGKSTVRRTCTGTVASDRTWTCTQTLPDGGYTWTAQVTAGGPLSQQIDFIVNTDDEDDQAPTIDHTPSPNNDSKPVLTGTVSYELVDDGARLEVRENGAAICVVNPLRSTNWACPLSTRLSEGPHLLAARAVSKKGDDTTPFGNPNAFVVKTSIGTPTLTSIATPTSENTIVFSGTGEPGAVVTVADGGVLVCQTTVSPGGRWSCAGLDPLSDGPHSISITQQDAAGNTSTAVTTTFVIDTRIPAAPTLDAPATPTSNPLVTLTGTGQAGALLSVTDSYSRLLCTATVSGVGAWSCTPAGGVADGDYLLTALQTTPVGKTSGPSTPVPLSVRTLRTPLFDAPASPTREKSPLLTGQAQAAAAVSVFLGETAVCAAQADATGHWSCRPEPALEDGSYLLLAQVSDAQGHASGPSAARSLRVDTQAPAAPVLEQPVLPTLKQKPVISGTAEAGSSVAVFELGGAGPPNAATAAAAICQATASAAGLFSCSPEVALSVGEHRLTAVATDDAGNASLEAEPIGVVVSGALTAPTIDSPANGTQVAERRPVIAGRTTPGTLVEVSVDSATFLAQVTAEGQWTVLPPEDLTLGAHDVTASASDQGQNVSDPAASRFSIIESGVARGGCASGGMPAPLLAVFAFLFAASRRRRSSWVAALLVCAAPALVRAQGLDLSMFRPAAGGDGFAAVEGARPPLPGEGRLELRTWTDYAVHPLTFVTSSGDTVLVRDRAAQWLGVQMHLIGPLSVAAQVPVTLVQRGDLSRVPTSSSSPELLSGFADLRLTPRLALLRQEWAGVDLATQISFELPTARSQSFSGDGTVRAEGLFALGRRFGPVPAGYLDLLANAYLRIRPEREFLDVRSGTEAGLRAGLGYVLNPLRAWVPRRIYAEFEGRTFLRAGFAAGTSPAEWRVGGTLCPVGNLAIDFAGGGALTDGIGAPRARFLFGLGWSPSACEHRAEAQLAAASPPPVPAPVQAPPPAPVAQALPLPAAPPMIVDRDGDGIPDSEDACPDQAGTVENHGCPAGVPQRVIVSATSLEILDRVHFASGRAQIEKRSYLLLDQVAAVIKSHPHLLLIEVEGHTDDRGGSSYNILLSQARASAVADYLVSKGVARSRLVPRGFGPTRPVGSNGTPTGRAENRRVAFTVVKTRARVIEAERPPDS